MVDTFDFVDEYVWDMCVVGGFLCDENVVCVMVEDLKVVVEMFIERGTRFTRDDVDGRLYFAREGGYSWYCIVYVDDMMGKEIECVLFEVVKVNLRIMFYEYYFVMELFKTRDGERCVGAFVVDEV